METSLIQVSSDQVMPILSGQAKMAAGQNSAS
jgi:hypothetical protein